MKREEGRGKNMHYMTVVSLEMSDEPVINLIGNEKCYHLHMNRLPNEMQNGKWMTMVVMWWMESGK